MAYYAIVSVSNERVAKYQKFATQAEADAHVATHGGFVAANPASDNVDDFRVSGQSVIIDPPPEPVPPYVLRYQFKKAVLDAGQLDAVKAQYANLSDASKLYWDDSNKIGRNSILITELQALMGFSDTAVDNFFKSAWLIES